MTSSNLNNIRQQLQSLVTRVEKLSVAAGKPKRQRRRKAKQQNQPTPGTTTTPIGTTQGRRRNRKQPKMAEGEIRMRRKELLTIVLVKQGSSSMQGVLDLSPENFKFLKGLYNSFERIKYHRLVVYYRSAVGTTQGGMVTYAIDWTLNSGLKGRTDLSSYTPNLSHPVWETPQGGLVLPAQKLQSRAWYINSDKADIVDRAPARLLYAADVSAPTADLTVGELWVEYDVTMSGTKS